MENQSNIGNYYLTYFDKLLKYDESSPLTSLICEDTALNQQNQENLLNSAKNKINSFVSNKFRDPKPRALDVNEQQTLAIRIEDWNEFILTELDDVTHISLEKVKELKKISCKLSNASDCIKNKLKELKIENEAISKALMRFDKRIIKINSINKIETETNKDSGLASMFNVSTQQSSLTFSRGHSNFAISNRNPFPFRKETIEANEKKKKFLTIEMEKRFSHLMPNQEGLWEKFLISEYCLLSTPEDICAAAQTMQSSQVLKIIQKAFGDVRVCKNLPWLIMALSFETLIQVLQALDVIQISGLNAIMLQSNERNHPLFDELFKLHRQKFIDSSNAKNMAIDDLDAKFREIDVNSITSEDIEDIFALRDDNLIHWDILKKYKRLIEGIFFDSETKRLFFGKSSEKAQLEMEYQFRMYRLSENENEMQLARGCPFGIIRGRVFEDRGFEDDQAAYEILAYWSIPFLVDARDIGLLGNISEDKFKEFTTDLKSISGKGLGYKYLQNRLEALGITSIKSWKEHRIFNKTMLVEFLQKAENQKLISS